MSNVIVLPPPASAATYRKMARARYREALGYYLADDFDTYLKLIGDVHALQDQADRARQQEERRVVQRWMTAQALARVLELAERKGARRPRRLASKRRAHK